MRRFLVVLFLLSFLIPIPALAQADLKALDEELAKLCSDDKTNGALNLTDLKIKTSNLALKLKPLTKEELETEMKFWIQCLKITANKLGDIEIKLQGLEDQEGEEAKGLKTLMDDLAARQGGLVERATAVKDAFGAKGGEVETYDKYLAVIAETPAMELSDFTDTGLFKQYYDDAYNWLISLDGGVKWAGRILSFILIIILAKIVSIILGGITSKAVGALKKTSKLLRDFFVNTVRKVTFIVGLIIALPFLGIDIGPILAAMGVIGFVVGFALQGTLSNFASGIMILMYRPYDIGDAVSVAGIAGKVDAMTLVSTTILTFDNQVVVIPNNSIWGDTITNITGSDTRRVDMVFGIGYEDDIEKALKILEEIITTHPKALKNPEPVVKLHELADSSVNFIARPWTKTSDYWDVYWDVTRQVKERFDAEGVSIPFPQRDIHVYEEKAG